MSILPSLAVVLLVLPVASADANGGVDVLGAACFSVDQDVSGCTVDINGTGNSSGGSGSAAGSGNANGGLVVVSVFGTATAANNDTCPEGDGYTQCYVSGNDPYAVLQNPIAISIFGNASATWWYWQGCGHSNTQCDNHTYNGISVSGCRTLRELCIPAPTLPP